MRRATRRATAARALLAFLSCVPAHTKLRKPSAPRWYFTHIPKAGGTVIADMLAQCLRQIPGAKPPCGIGPRSPFDHVCERSPAVVAKSQRSVLRFARGAAGCSLVETHHDHSLLQAANKTAGARRASRARADSLTDPPPHA